MRKARCRKVFSVGFGNRRDLGIVTPMQQNDYRFGFANIDSVDWPPRRQINVDRYQNGHKILIPSCYPDGSGASESFQFRDRLLNCDAAFANSLVAKRVTEVVTVRHKFEEW